VVSDAIYIYVVIFYQSSHKSLYIYIYILSANDYSFPEACYDTRGCLSARLGVKRTSASLKLFFPRLYDFPLKTGETLKISFVR